MIDNIGCRILKAPARTLPTTVETLLTTVKNLTNPSPMLFRESSPILNFSVISWNFLDRSDSCWPVIGGNTLVNASFTLSRIDNSPVKTFVRPAIIASRPPVSFHTFKRLFLALADSSTMSFKTLLTPVHRVLASSMLPKTISQLCAQPEPRASFVVSIS